jgi:hypothetical protein
MARPRTPAHLKPIPTTISMTPDNRRFLDEKHGGNVSAFVNAAVADFRRSEDALSDAKDHQARTARRVAAITAGHGNAVSAAFSLIGDEPDEAVLGRLMATVCTRVSCGADISTMDTAVFLFHALDHALNQAAGSEPEVDESLCINVPLCTGKKDRRRKDGLCFRCAQGA